MSQAGRDITHPARHGWRQRRRVILLTLLVAAVLLAGWALAGALETVRRQNREQLQLDRTSLISEHVNSVFFAAHSEALRRLPVRPWAPDLKDRWVRIVPTSITGRVLQSH